MGGLHACVCVLHLLDVQVCPLRAHVFIYVLSFCPDTNIFMLAEWGAARYSFYTLRFVDSKVDIYFAFVAIPIARALY